MSLKQGFVLGIGALGGGALGFYIQDRFMRGYRAEQDERIELEARRRFEALRIEGASKGSGCEVSPMMTRAHMVEQAGTKLPPAGTA